MQLSHADTSSKLMRFLSPVLLAAMLMFNLGCNGKPKAPPIPTNIEFRPDGLLDFIDENGEIVTRIVIEMAESDSAQARGLMDRRSIPARGGMLFIDPEPSERSFWMRSTPLPLDIVFVRSDSTIANIVKRTTPYSDDRILSEGLAQFVVEVRAGFTDQYGVNNTHHVRWERTEQQP